MNKLTQAIATTEQWANLNNMTINKKKSKIMIMGDQSNNEKHKLTKDIK